VQIIAECVGGLINSNSTYIITLLKVISVCRKTSFKFYRPEESVNRITPFVTFLDKQVLILTRIYAIRLL
jgi:hypothetical protein